MRFCFSAIAIQHGTTVAVDDRHAVLGRRDWIVFEGARAQVAALRGQVLKDFLRGRGLPPVFRDFVGAAEDQLAILRVKTVVDAHARLR